jgi:hypothetical protein
MVDPHGVEVLQAGKFIRQVGIATDDAGAVSQHTHDAAVLPVSDFFFVGSLKLPQQVSDLRFLGGQTLQILNKAGIWTGFQLIQQWGFVHEVLLLTEMVPKGLILFFTNIFVISYHHKKFVNKKNNSILIQQP